MSFHPGATRLSALAARRDRVRSMALFSRDSLAPVHTRVAVVLIHGLVVSSGGLRPALQRIGNPHRCYAPDLPGYGFTARHALPGPLPLADFNAFVEESRGRHAVVLEKLKLVGATHRGD